MTHARWNTLLLVAGVAAAALLGSCSNISFTQRNSPANMYKDYRPEDASRGSVIGLGEPISARQMAANSTISLNGQYDLEQVLQKMAGTYNVAIRWGNGVRRTSRQQVIMNNLSFDEARNYLEDVFDIQIIKEGERRLLILPSASEPRLAAFNPGTNVTLSQALRGLAEQCQYNLVITENKQMLGQIRVTTNLKDVTCYDAFEALLSPHGLSLVNAGDYYTIGGLPQRQWTLNLYEPKRSEKMSVQYASDFSSNNGSGSGSGGGGSQTAGGSNAVDIVYDRDLWQDLEDDLKELIKNRCPVQMDAGSSGGEFSDSAQLLPPPDESGKSGESGKAEEAKAAAPVAAPAPAPVAVASGNDETRCGYIRINKSVGLVQMRAPESVLNEANDVIQRVEEVASRRLMLEARVVAVTRTRNFNQNGGFTQGRRSSNKDQNSLGGGFSGSVASALNRALSNYGNNSNQMALGGFSLQNQNLDLAVGLLEQYGTTYELMHPMMELMDRQRATLIDGRNEKYFVLKSESTTGTATTTSVDIEERNQFLGMQFSATAQVSDNASEPHTVALQIPITSLAKTVNIPGSVSGSISGVAPVANTRLIDQKVRIRDGEIKVIGGLTKTVAVDSESGLPILRDIPALGKLANEEGITYEEMEFVVLLQVKRLN